MLEVALAVVLVIGAGLLLRSLWNLTAADAGFKRSQLVTFGLVLPAAQYQEPQSRVDFFQRLTGQLSAISGVQSAAVDESACLPNASSTPTTSISRAIPRGPKGRSKTSTTSRP
jgi:hypothetical protein